MQNFLRNQIILAALLLTASCVVAKGAAVPVWYPNQQQQDNKRKAEEALHEGEDEGQGQEDEGQGQEDEGQGQEDEGQEDEGQGQEDEGQALSKAERFYVLSDSILYPRLLDKNDVILSQAIDVPCENGIALLTALQRAETACRNLFDTQFKEIQNSDLRRGKTAAAIGGTTGALGAVGGVIVALVSALNPQSNETATISLSLTSAVVVAVGGIATPVMAVTDNTRINVLRISQQNINSTLMHINGSYADGKVDVVSARKAISEAIDYCKTTREVLCK
ncbi:hypothetical protein ACNOYE_29370 [Nannocystaceae bacterium ST9]